MCEHECLLGYLEALRQMLTNYGSPKYLYPDKYSVFFPLLCLRKLRLKNN